MYVPPLDSILRSIGISRAEFASATEVTIPAELFKLLLQVAVAASDFNEQGYLRENPDIADGVRSGRVDDPRTHYVGFGYFEGRLGATPQVDERWYLQTYTDIAQAVKIGRIKSAKEHYEMIGAAEGRAPNSGYISVADQWKKALTGIGAFRQVK